MTTEPQILTFGCRLNAYESEVMRRHARAAGLEDVIIVNTCTVTQEAEKEARQAIRRARRASPDARIIVTGCAAQVDPDGFAAMPEVDSVIGNDAKLDARTWLELGQGGDSAIIASAPQDLAETSAHLVEGFEGYTRAFVQVQQGCDHRCTFCIIPFGRGPSRSVPIGVIVDHMRKLVEQGYREIVVTGVDIASYGPDLPGRPTLGQMLRRVLALVPELPRLRLSSLDPAAIDPDLWALIADEPRLMPHLHLSIQAGDDMILKRMKRRHLRGDILALHEKAKRLRPDMVFGADLIAGFPTETEEMFRNSLDLIHECELTWLHVFPYSPRSGTPAARMPQVPSATRKERAAILRAAGQVRQDAFFASCVGKKLDILVEKGNIGRTEHFAPVRPDRPCEPGQIVSVEIAGADKTHLSGRVVAA